MTMKIKSYTVGIGLFQPHSEKEVFATNKRSARWIFINLHQPFAKYSETWCNGTPIKRRKTLS